MSNAYLINYEKMEWPIYEGDFRLMFPNTSFPVPLIDVPAPFAWVQDVNVPTYNVITQGVEEVQPHQENGEWFRTWVVYGLSPEQIAENENAEKQANKSQAESLLQATDWTATVDIANPQYSDPYLANQDAFLAYRSNVRKIAVNPPIVVDEWPTIPVEQWSNAL